MSRPGSANEGDMIEKRALPATGMGQQAVLDRLRALQVDDAHHAEGRCFGLVYAASSEVDELLHRAASLSLLENAFNPRAFPSLRRMEDDIVAMTASLLHGTSETSGVMTSGGTESIFLAVKTARDRHLSKRPRARCKLIVPRTAHPAFRKAAAFLGVEWVQLPMDGEHRTAPEDLRAAIDADTILAVGSAPAYPWGTIDDIPRLSAVAAERGVAFHVDASIGGFFLPFAERAGHPIPSWDFRVPGVTSISADLHKFGYALKGASVLLHRDRRAMVHQVFQFADWPGGVYGTRTFMGSRPAAPISAAWAVLHHLGESGYVALARRALEAVDIIRGGLAEIGAHVWGNPIGPVLAIGSHSHDILKAAELLSQTGWHVDRQECPDAIHLMVSPRHVETAPAFLAELGQALITGRGLGRRQRASYGDDFSGEAQSLFGGSALTFAE